MILALQGISDSLQGISDSLRCENARNYNDFLALQGISDSLQGISDSLQGISDGAEMQ